MPFISRINSGAFWQDFVNAGKKNTKFLYTLSVPAKEQGWYKNGQIEFIKTYYKNGNLKKIQIFDINGNKLNEKEKGRNNGRN